MTVKIYRQFILLAFLILAGSVAYGQKQLVFLKKEKVILRLNPGDEFIFSLKGSKGIQRSYINNLFDTAALVHKTIIPFQKIDKIYFTQQGLVNLMGRFLVVAGVGYFVIDQINVMVVNGDEASLDDNVTTASVAMVAAGLPMMLIKKKSQRIGGRYRLLTVQKGSPFYIPPINQYD